MRTPISPRCGPRASRQAGAARRLMPTHAERQVVPYTPEQLFDLVADVGSYPRFLPWCVASRIRTRTDTELVADLTIGFGPFRESFTSRVTLDRPRRVTVKYENGPFRYLNNQWDFTAARHRHRSGVLRRFRVPQPDSAGRDRRGVQRGGAADGQRLSQAGPRRLWSTIGPPAAPATYQPATAIQESSWFTRPPGRTDPSRRCG